MLYIQKYRVRMIFYVETSSWYMYYSRIFTLLICLICQFICRRPLKFLKLNIPLWRELLSSLKCIFSPESRDGSFCAGSPDWRWQHVWSLWTSRPCTLGGGQASALAWSLVFLARWLLIHVLISSPEPALSVSARLLSLSPFLYFTPL
jgi:hypothetical protein